MQHKIYKQKRQIVYYFCLKNIKGILCSMDKIIHIVHNKVVNK